MKSDRALRIILVAIRTLIAFQLPMWAVLGIYQGKVFAVIPSIVVIMVMFCSVVSGFYDHDEDKESRFAIWMNDWISVLCIRIGRVTDKDGTYLVIAMPYVPFYDILHRWDPVETKFLIKIAKRSELS